MAKVRPRRLVIDASVGRAAGDKASGVSFHCTEFLATVLDVGHAAVMSRELLAEWHRHRSRFATTWLRKMYGSRKVIAVDLPPDDQLRTAVGQSVLEAAVAAIMLKDCHLIEAALATDRRVASLDDNVRQHFARCAEHVRPLRRVCWVNPAVVEERSVDWLHHSAPLDRHRLLNASATRGG
jgi:hypothetical protein